MFAYIFGGRDANAAVACRHAMMNDVIDHVTSMRHVMQSRHAESNPSNNLFLSNPGARFLKQNYFMDLEKPDLYEIV
jgi:hypothetical protein